METVAKTLEDRLDKILTLQTTDGRRTTADDRDRPNKQSKRINVTVSSPVHPIRTRSTTYLLSRGDYSSKDWIKGTVHSALSPDLPPLHSMIVIAHHLQYSHEVGMTTGIGTNLPPHGMSQDHPASHIRHMMAADSIRDLNTLNHSTQDRSTGLPRQQNLRVRIVDHQSDLGAGL